MIGRLSHAEANLAAEIRGIEEGHRAWLTGEHTCRVKSDSTEGLWWVVTAQATHPGAGIVFHCTPDRDGCEGHGDHWSRTPGRVTCKHAAVLCRRLERLGLARWDHGMWLATDKAAEVAPVGWVADPFRMLGRAS